MYIYFVENIKFIAIKVCTFFFHFHFAINKSLNINILLSINIKSLEIYIYYILKCLQHIIERLDRYIFNLVCSIDPFSFINKKKYIFFLFIITCKNSGIAI